MSTCPENTFARVMSYCPDARLTVRQTCQELAGEERGLEACLLAMAQMEGKAVEKAAAEKALAERQRMREQARAVRYIALLAQRAELESDAEDSVDEYCESFASYDSFW